MNNVYVWLDATNSRVAVVAASTKDSSEQILNRDQSLVGGFVYANRQYIDPGTADNDVDASLRQPNNPADVGSERVLIVADATPP